MILSKLAGTSGEIFCDIDTFVHQGVVVHICLFGPKESPEPMLIHFQLAPYKHIPVKFE